MNVLFYITFAFIVVVILVYLADSMSTAMVMVGCLSYILIIANHMITLQDNVNEKLLSAAASKNTQQPVAEPGSILDDTAGAAADGAAADAADGAAADTQHSDEFMRTREWNEYDSFKTTYTDTYTNPTMRTAYDNCEKTNSIDAANVMMATRRFREKRAMDGATIKNANYYKYHFGNELSTYENKPWWGRAEW